MKPGRHLTARSAVNVSMMRLAAALFRKQNLLAQAAERMRQQHRSLVRQVSK